MCKHSKYSIYDTYNMKEIKLISRNTGCNSMFIEFYDGNVFRVDASNAPDIYYFMCDPKNQHAIPEDKYILELEEIYLNEENKPENLF